MRNYMKLLATCVSLAVLPILAVAGMPADADSRIPTVGEGTLVPVETPAGTFNVWTKKVGENPTIKVLLLHGGPGATHEQWESIEEYLTPAGIEFYYYDQLGSYFSDQPDEPALWTLERFVEEVEQVRQALGLGPDNFYLVGQSWGGMLAIEYALKYQKYLKGLVISNMMASIPAYNRYAADVLMADMDPMVLEELKAFEAAEDYHNERYSRLLIEHHYVDHILRMPADQWPDAVNLHRITVPTLVIGATHDTMDPLHTQWMAEQLPNGRFLLCPNGSHLSQWDDPENYSAGLIKFMKEVDSSVF
jgi:proline iminopeptidase